MQVFNNKESLGKLTKLSATSVQLSASNITVGARQYSSSSISCDITVAGVGGLDTGSEQSGQYYYVYAVNNSGNLALVCSLSSIGPSGYNQYKKVGAFVNDFSGDVEQVMSVGEQPNSTIRLHETKTVNGGFGSTGTAIILWSSVLQNLGISAKYIPNETNGDSFLIKDSGNYSVSMGWACSVTNQEFGITKNGDNTSTIASVNGSSPEQVLAQKRNHTANIVDFIDAETYLEAGTVIKARRNASSAAANVTENRFTISKIGTNEIDWS